jgi:hypothetical protein
MKLSHKMGLSACTALMAVSGFALAADVAATNTYYGSGYTVASTCPAAYGAVGYPSNPVVFYPGASGKTLTLVSAATTPTSNPGAVASYTCRAGTYVPSSVVKGKTVNATWTPAAVPAGGLNGAKLPFACFADSLAGPGDGGSLPTNGKAPVISVSIGFTAAATHAGSNVLVVETNEVFPTGATTTCTVTADEVWYAH